MTEKDNSQEERAHEVQQLGQWIMSQDDAKIQEMVDDDVLFIPPPIENERS